MTHAVALGGVRTASLSVARAPAARAAAESGGLGVAVRVALVDLGRHQVVPAAGDRPRDGDALDRRRIRAQRLDLDLEARVGGGDDAVAATFDWPPWPEH